MQSGPTHPWIEIPCSGHGFTTRPEGLSTAQLEKPVGQSCRKHSRRVVDPPGGRGLSNASLPGADHRLTTAETQVLLMQGHLCLGGGRMSPKKRSVPLATLLCPLLPSRCPFSHCFIQTRAPGLHFLVPLVQWAFCQSPEPPSSFAEGTQESQAHGAQASATARLCLLSTRAAPPGGPPAYSPLGAGPITPFPAGEGSVSMETPSLRVGLVLFHLPICNADPQPHCTHRHKVSEGCVCVPRSKATWERTTAAVDQGWGATSPKEPAVLRPDPPDPPSASVCSFPNFPSNPPTPGQGNVLRGRDTLYALSGPLCQHCQFASSAGRIASPVMDLFRP